VEYVAKVEYVAGESAARTVYGYGATDGAAVANAVDWIAQARGEQVAPDSRLTVYREEDDGSVEVRYVMSWGRYCVETS
jgi:hypothetical protein